MRMPDKKPFCSLKIGELSAQPGLGHFRLTIPLLWELAGRPADALATLSGLLGCVSVSRTSGEAERLGRAMPEWPAIVRSLTTDHDISTELVLELDRPRIDAVERLRQGGDLKLQVAVSGTVEIPGSDRQPVGTEASRTITQVEWLRLLDAMGYGKAIVVEVPVLATGECDQLVEAAKRLKRAMSALGCGDYPGVVAASRDVLDAIESTPAARSVGELPNNHEEWNKPQRFKNVRRALYRLASPAHHADPHAAAIEWDRSDALALVAAVAAELMRCCEELRRPK